MKKLKCVVLAAFVFELFLSCQTAKPAAETASPEFTTTENRFPAILNLAPEADKPLYLLFDSDLCVFIGEKGLLFNYGETETPNNIDAYKIWIGHDKYCGLYCIKKSGFDDYVLSFATEEGWQHIKNFATLEELYRWAINGTE